MNDYQFTPCACCGHARRYHGDYERRDPPRACLPGWEDTGCECTGFVEPGSAVPEDADQLDMFRRTA